jgi:hypothetical protein
MRLEKKIVLRYVNKCSFSAVLVPRRPDGRPRLHSVSPAHLHPMPAYTGPAPLDPPDYDESPLAPLPLLMRIHVASKLQ